MRYEIVNRAEMAKEKIRERLDRGTFSVTSQLTSYAQFAEKVYSSAERVEKLAECATKNAQALVAEFSQQERLFAGIWSRIIGARIGEAEFPRHYIALFKLLEDRLNQSIINYHGKIGEAA